MLRNLKSGKYAFIPGIYTRKHISPKNLGTFNSVEPRRTRERDLDDLIYGQVLQEFL